VTRYPKASDISSLAWAPAATANSQKMHSLFPDIDIATQISPIVIPKFESNPDPSGLIATDQPGGPLFRRSTRSSRI
jgi:hypothetical protein